MTVVLAMGVAAVGAWLAVRPPTRPYPLLTVAGTFGRHLRRRMMTRRRQHEQRAATRDALAEIAADVRVGQPPLRALERSLSERGIAPRTVAAVRLGGDVVASLRADADDSRQPLLAGVGACWSVAESHGAGLADALDRLVAAERRAEEVRRQLQAHLAAPRATARMLALLPALGLVLGLAVGGDPLGWLLGTPFGWGCLGLGLVLIGVGLAWAQRIASRTERLL